MPQAVKGGFAPLYFSAFLVAVSSAANPAPESVTFDAFERTIPEIQAAMARGETTAEELVRQYLARIEAFDHSGPQLNAMIHINPRAIEEAAALDRERAAGNIPVLYRKTMLTRYGVSVRPAPYSSARPTCTNLPGA
jgi:hypothetical protein